MINFKIGKTCGEDGIGEVKDTREKIHQYLGMKLVYTYMGKLKIDTQEYMEEMVEEFLKDLTGKFRVP